MGAHLIDGKFQSDKYPTTPRGKVPLSCADAMAQDLLWEYAQRRRAVDAEFSDDLEAALRLAGYKPRGTTTVAKVADLIKDDKDAPLPLSVIPNYMGINLCSVDALSWVRRPDRQLVSVTIHFIPHESGYQGETSDEDEDEALEGRGRPLV